MGQVWMDVKAAATLPISSFVAGCLERIDGFRALGELHVASPIAAYLATAETFHPQKEMSKATAPRLHSSSKTRRGKNALIRSIIPIWGRRNQRKVASQMDQDRSEPRNLNFDGGVAGRLRRMPFSPRSPCLLPSTPATPSCELPRPHAPTPCS